jgi:hypothetical protein
MPGKRNSRSRVRGSWAARLTGAGFAILLAVVGVATYLVVGGSHASKDATALPTRVLGTQAIGLISTGPAASGDANPNPQTLLASRSGLSFVTSGQSGANWTADQMAGGTYIFIYLPTGQCLGPSSLGSLAGLAKCNLAASQRWVRRGGQADSTGLEYWQIRNLASGLCLTSVAAKGSAKAGASAARLQRCQSQPGWRQLIAFLTAD